jgi:hypothetical protein
MYVFLARMSLWYLEFAFLSAWASCCVCNISKPPYKRWCADASHEKGDLQGIFEIFISFSRVHTQPSQYGGKKSIISESSKAHIDKLKVMI